jgi:hypothetical protein
LKVYARPVNQAYQTAQNQENSRYYKRFIHAITTREDQLHGGTWLFTGYFSLIASDKLLAPVPPMRKVV